MTPDDIARATGGNLTQSRVEAIHPHLRPLALVLVSCGVLPGAAYILCGAALRRGLRIGAHIAIVLAATQLIVLAFILARQLLLAIGAGDPPALTQSALLLGTPMALLVYVIRTLFEAQQRPAKTA